MRNTILLLAGLFFILAGSSFAFHDAGVADCGGCHTMHNSEDGALVDPESPSGNPYLLIDATPSDVCLTCHATGSRGVLQVDPLNPSPEKGAGNFIFLLEDNMNDGHGGGDTLADGSWANPIPGYKAGHNVIAPGHGLTVDPTAFPANAGPGGNFNKNWLGCSSCHDPHGNENFRLLYGADEIQDGLYEFVNPAPIAVGLSLRTQSEGLHTGTAYQSGMSAWCGNCHAGMHTASNGGALKHPSGVNLTPTIAAFYGTYNGTADMTGGDPLTSYIPQVAFEDAARTVASTAGPSTSSQVSCITCHRAHASGAPNAGRWDFNLTLLDEDGVTANSYKIPQPYGPNQRSLCNKCHGKDIHDELPF